MTVNGKSLRTVAGKCVLVRERDRLWVILSPGGFAVWSLFSPTPSMKELTTFGALGTYLLLGAASVFLLAGTYKPHWPLFVLGHLLAIVGVLTVAAVVGFTSGTPVAALLFGFAITFSWSLTKSMRARRLVLEEIAHHPEREEISG